MKYLLLLVVLVIALVAPVFIVASQDSQLTYSVGGYMMGQIQRIEPLTAQEKSNRQTNEMLRVTANKRVADYDQELRAKYGMGHERPECQKMKSGPPCATGLFTQDGKYLVLYAN